MNGDESHDSGQISLRVTDPVIFPLVSPDVRAPVRLLWQLDARLGQLAHAGKEPALRQIRLRWWADQLAGLAADRGSPEPLLAEVATQLLPSLPAQDLADLAEHWMDLAVAGEDDAIPTGHGRALFRLTDAVAGHAKPRPSVCPGDGWALAVELLHRHSTDEQLWARASASLVPSAGMARALAAVTGLARSIARRRGERRRGLEQLLILRIGLLGR